MNIFFRIKKSIQLFKAFGLMTFLDVWIFPKLECNSIKSESKKHKAVLRYLKKKYSSVVEKYQNAQIPSEVISNDCPIWICWFQGIENAPLLIQKCVESVRRFSGNHPVILLTMNNYMEYCSIPYYIIRKVENKDITLTHFSDILRNALLSQKGGIWLDASIYLTSNYRLYNLPYQTIRQEKCDDGKFVSAYRWTGFCQAGVIGNPLNCFVYDMFLTYHKCEKALLDYYLIDYFMALGYNSIKAVKDMVDNIPYNNNDLYYIQKYMLKPYQRDEFNKIKKQTFIFKLNQRISTGNEDSMYWHILNDDL